MDKHGIPVSVEITPRGQRSIEAQARDAAYDAAIKYAADLGAEHGRNAAAWYFDGNTPADTYARVLAGIEDGDPEVLDTLPAPDLSGEWADGLTGPMLAHEACVEAGAMDSNDDDASCPCGEWSPDICDAYETAFSQAATDAIETAARAILAD